MACFSGLPSARWRRCDLAFCVSFNRDTASAWIIPRLPDSIVKECLADHHSLRQQSFERFVKSDQSKIAHHLCPKPRIDQMHHGVVVAADVLVDRRPIFASSGSNGMTSFFGSVYRK